MLIFQTMLVLLAILPIPCLSYNFLVFCPLFAHSHHKFLGKIADTLSEAGHNVTFLSPIIVKEYEKIKYVHHVKDVVYIQPDTELERLGESADYSNFWLEEAGVFSMVPTAEKFFTMFQTVYENVRKNLTVLNDLKSRNFDAIIYEPLSYCAHPIHDYLGIKTVLPSFSMTHYTDTMRAIGEPSAPSVFPTTVSPYGGDMSFYERLMNSIGDFVFSYVLQPGKMYSYKDPHRVIDIFEIESGAPFVFMNSNPYLDFPRPTIQKTIPIGGISINVTKMRAESLPRKFQQILSKRNKTVLISFGSMVLSKDMPQNYKETLIRIIKSFPNVTFIWKYETEPEKWGLENLHFSKWVPQTALLADSRLSAFMTHGGLGSVNELSYLGKPAILVPIFADQMRNSKMLERHNGSICLRKQDLGNYEKLRWAFSSILEDPSYQKRAEILADQLAAQPIPPHVLLINHAEFGARFGKLPSLDPVYRKMSFFSYFMIDIILFFVISFLLFVGILYFAIRHLMTPRIKTKLQ